MQYTLKEADHVFYCLTYIPVHDFHKYSDSITSTSVDIWYYKNGIEPIFSRMSYIYTKAVKELIETQPMKTKVALVCVPPSKTNTFSPVKESIQRILAYKNRLNGQSKDPFFFHTIIDHSDLLVRTTDISTSHREHRAKEWEHKNSIRCQKDTLNAADVTYILMDDVTTTGTILHVCENILITHGVAPDSIYKMALAKTKSERTYEEI